MPPTGAEASAPAALTQADVVRLREEVGTAESGQPKSTLHRRWLEACHVKLHGAVCHVERCATQLCVNACDGRKLKNFLNATRAIEKSFIQVLAQKENRGSLQGVR